MPEASTAASTTPGVTQAGLDDVMLAMDVVDTLRHRETLIEQELAEPAREEQLLERLRQIYASQGISVTDQILEEGIAALREDRFVYKPPAKSGATRWAHAYVDRAKWGRALLAVLVVAALAYAAYFALVVAPHRQLVNDLATVHAQVLAVSQVPAADARANTLYQEASTAAERGDRAEARTAYDSLVELRDQLERSYTLRISPGPDTGFWRIPDVNLGARNYYIVVDAVDANGRNVVVPVVNEETGLTERVSQWGLRVDEATFEGVRQDKLDDGIIQNAHFGEKRAGFLEPEYAFPTTGGAVTDWSEW